MTAFDFGPMLDARVARFTVGLVDVESSDPRPFGSGTLVEIANTRGILTCAHVTEAIKPHKEVGICLFPVRPTAVQTQRVAVSNCVPNAVSFLDLPYSMNGRDLSYLPLPTDIMSTVAGTASIVNLDLHETRSKSPPPDNATAFEVVAGVVEARTPPAKASSQRILLSVEGIINVGRFIQEWKNDGFDLIEFHPIPEPGFPEPSTYGGTSGGGMWRIYVRQLADGTYEHIETRLVGVAFWETEGPDRNLIGHGPISVFGHLLTAIRHA